MHDPASGYDLPRPTAVRLAIYDLLGREVAVVVLGKLAEGRHEAESDARALAAGVYVVRLTTGRGAVGRRLVVAR